MSSQCLQLDDPLVGDLRLLQPPVCQPIFVSPTVYYHELIAFTGSVTLQTQLVDFPFRAAGLDLLSIYAFGAICELQRAARINANESFALCRRMLREFFACSSEGAARRQRALTLALQDPSSRFHRLIQRGGKAFRAWQAAPQSFEGEDFRSLLRTLCSKRRSSEARRALISSATDFRAAPGLGM